MAHEPQEIRIARIIACFAPGRAVAPRAIARLAKDTQAELLGLFIEDAELLRFAALPFAAEVGYPSAARRTLDLAAVERALRNQAASVRQALAASLGTHEWSFRVARASASQAVAAALAEGYAPSLVIPPGSNLRAERRIVSAAELDEEALRALLAGARPLLIVPRTEE
jgi:hypothetical protein